MNDMDDVNDMIECASLEAALADHRRAMELLQLEEMNQTSYYVTKKGKIRRVPKPLWFYVIDPGDCYSPYDLWLRMQIGA